MLGGTHAQRAVHVVGLVANSEHGHDFASRTGIQCMHFYRNAFTSGDACE
jgi:hypothetical protein